MNVSRKYLTEQDIEGSMFASNKNICQKYAEKARWWLNQ